MKADEQLGELLYQALETEMGGVQVYETAVQCAVNEELKGEWQAYLEQTRRHVQIVTEVFEKVGLDPSVETPGREVVREKAGTLVRSMQMAQSAGDPGAAQLVAAEAVVDAETKDHQNWELIGLLADH